MKLLPIEITARRGNWERFVKRKRSKRFQELAGKILKRDNNTCRYCGFKSDKYMHIVNHDHDYTNNQASNLVTACMFCAQCFFLESLGKNKRTGGYLVYLPEITQADISHFTRVLFASLLRDAPYKGKLQTAYLSLKDRGAVVEEIFGPGSSKPEVFGASLLDSDLSNENLQHPVFKDLRVLPERKFFTEEIKYWKQTVFDQIPL